MPIYTTQCRGQRFVELWEGRNTNFIFVGDAALDDRADVSSALGPGALFFFATKAHCTVLQERSKYSLSAQFRQQLDKLMTQLNATQTHYIRCIKPNNDKAPSQIDPMLTLEQLRYSGVFEAVRIRKQVSVCISRDFLSQLVLTNTRRGTRSATRMRDSWSDTSACCWRTPNGFL